MNSCVLCLGSNTVDSASKLDFALSRLADYIAVENHTEAYGCPSYNGLGASYSNVVVVGTTDLTENQLVTRTKIIEIEAGRTPASKLTGNMPLDIDLVIFNDLIVSPDDYRRTHFQLGYQKLANG